EAPAVPAVIFTEPELAAVGASEEDLRGQGVAYRKALVPLAVSGRFAVECPGAAGTVKVLAGAGDGRLLGVHVLGGPAGEMIGAACAMVAQKMTAAQAAAVVVPHPTVGEALKAALERLAAAG
ncbi:MAG: dihydrolipoyl dehydrogenase, partial [Planctomycetes bacterium]|nr:dihydrolipoyl dehydrogenase [Planctomycetota bacterium]